MYRLPASFLHTKSLHYPTAHTNVYEQFLLKQGLTAVAVLDTHIHADHISGAGILSKNLSVPYLLPEISDVDFPFDPLENTLPNIAVGASVECIPTPGHTRESVSLLIDDVFLISGDTLFVDAVSRTDLTEDEESASQTLYESVTGNLFKLKDRIHLLPAHTIQPMVPGPLRTATLRYVKLFNPIREFSSAREYAAHIELKDNPEPPNYKTIKSHNKSGRIPRGLDINELELGGNFCAIALPE